MKKVLFLLFGLILVSACVTTQPEPTSTPLPPTDTSIPPTQTPEPAADEVLLAFADAVNNKEYEKAKTFFSEDITMRDRRGFYDGLEGIDKWLQSAEKYEDTYSFSEFVVNADDVEFKFITEGGEIGKYMCGGYATMEGVKILSLEVWDCESVSASQAPNPYAEEVILALAEAVNNRDEETANSFFSQDNTLDYEISSILHTKSLDGWLADALAYEEVYEFSGFVISGDKVKFNWVVFIPDHVDWPGDKKYKCSANATMDEDMILVLEVTSCNKQ